MSAKPNHPPRLRDHRAHVLGMRVSLYSQALLEELAKRAHLPNVRVTSVERRVEDQARIFFQKHVVEAKKASYKNPEVGKMLEHARGLHKKGSAPEAVTAYLVRSIEHVHGGAQTISRHLGRTPFIEVFDVAHYSGPTTGAGRHNHMTNAQAKAFLAACRTYMSFPITRLGHSAELGFSRAEEFTDEKCFHFEVAQPFLENATSPSGNLIA
jgi:hypothetical protein